MNNQWKQYIPGCVLGNVLELYEFIIYGYFANIISKIFFPMQNQYISLMITFAVFATGSFIRPFSAILFGYLGDTYGRRKSLIISIGMMAMATFCMGLLPSYEQVGLLAPILLVVCRLAQGLSMTSEQVGAALYLMENAPDNKKAYAGSLVMGSVYIGLLLGSLITAIIVAVIPQSSLTAWGWRLPFLLGGIFGFFALLTRIKQPESYEFSKAQAYNLTTSHPIHELFKKNIKSLLMATALFSSMATAVYLFAVYVPNLLNNNTIHIGKASIMILCSGGFITAFLVSLISGIWTDKVGTQLPLLLSSLGFLVFAYPIFYLFSIESLLAWFIGYMILAILLGLMAGAVMLPAMKPFKTSIKFSACCISFNLSMSLFGGTAPCIALYLNNLTHSKTSAAFLLISTALISLAALYRLNKHVIDKETTLCQLDLL